MWNLLQEHKIDLTSKKSINVIQYINNIKNKPHDHLNKFRKKTFDRIQ